MRVLIVDDEHLARQAMRRLLADHPAGEIAALRADGDFTHVFVAGRPAVMIWRTLSHFEELLPSPPFLRLSRSLIINRDRLRKIEAPSRDSAQVTLDGVAEPMVLGR